ncbi:hypothetical protein ACHAWF_001962 [Thalassiosira exigua]
MTMSCGRAPPRQLEDVLQDPDAKWGEIREAMKSSRACTNTAIMRAIASGRGVAVAVDGELELLASKSSREEEAPPPDDMLDEENKLDGEGEELNEVVVVPLNDAPGGDDLTNSKGRKPARRAHRRGSLRGSSSSVRRSGRSIAHRNSVNLMDFGVDHDLGMVDETASLDDEKMSRRESVKSFLDDESCFSDDGGFMGWNRPNRSLGSNSSSMNSAEMKSSFQSNMSDLVDSSGFLDWDRKKEPDDDCALWALDCSSKASKTSAPDSHVAAGGMRSAALSIKASFVGGKKHEQWNIEDYENPDDNVVNSKIKRGSGGGGNFFSNHLRRLSTEAKPPQLEKSEAEEIRMDDVKEALLKVSQQHKSYRSLPASRRTSCDDDESPGAKVPGSKKPLKRASGPRRQTIIGLPAFLGGAEVRAGNETDKNGSTSPDECAKKNEIPTYRRKGNGGAHKATSAPTNSRMSFFAAPDKMKEGNTLWDGGPKNAAHEDSREAIWVNRKDGGVNIEKECRKLYSEDGKDKVHKMQSYIPRRATLLGELKRPVLPPSSGFEGDNIEW